ncbi:class I SAM-dependent methyltransferase [Prosthecomicrobium hirschii]|uniref:Methyltransferase type 11 domain-containing protein n=1 Tax=Prosthecodimorpha hirschii TaxID=665126 RepID=A0A0P6W398_9HYPH|nr:methyltransferase domain-containing protein [Prosthecomicrobium hirschii]KPL52831.1 hypothetical protein ABB55_11920 [Prosthecomicrobium hirschii]MCW1841780.1 methyltransferase domain-containing protein [Prosthecomicrobium hirschii]
MTSPSPTPACTVCGGTVFSPGPAGRLSESGKPPHCTRCGSLERHRANRALFQHLPIGVLSWRRALQFSPDVALAPAWFASLEVSVYGGQNSLDLQKIDRPDDSYDFISLSHVLEFVPDDRASFRELTRILSPAGLIHLVVSRPLSRETSQDFETATGVHQYFHLYGRDFAVRFGLAEAGLHLLVVQTADPVTGDTEAVHLIAKSAAVLAGVGAYLREDSRYRSLQPPPRDA